MGGRSILTIAVGLLVAFSPGVRARAAESACAEKVLKAAKPEAARLVAAGKEALNAGRFEDALTLFERAYCVAPVIYIRHGLSSAALNLGRCSEALRHAAFWDDNASPDDRARSQDWLQEVKRQCVEVSIASNPAGAFVFIDGEKGAPIATPWRGFLRMGNHSLIATKEGFFKTRKDIEVPAGARSAPFDVSLDLTELPSRGTSTAAAPPPVASSGSGPAERRDGPVPAENGAYQRQTTTPMRREPAEAHSSPSKPLTDASTVHLQPMKLPAEERPFAALVSPHPLVRDIGFAGIAVGGAALAVAIVLGVTVRNDTSAVGMRSGERTTAQAAMLYNSINERSAGADSLFGIGGVLAAGGVALAVAF
jgi:hypothetical protein